MTHGFIQLGFGGTLYFFCIIITSPLPFKTVVSIFDHSMNITTPFDFD